MLLRLALQAPSRRGAEELKARSHDWERCAVYSTQEGQFVRGRLLRPQAKACATKVN